MMQDWTGFKCGHIELICPVGRIKDMDTVRKVWMYLDKKYNEHRFIRSNEIRRKCRQIEFAEKEVKAYFNIKRTCLQTSNIAWLTGDKQFSRRKFADRIPDKFVESQISNLTERWLGYQFEVVECEPKEN